MQADFSPAPAGLFYIDKPSSFTFRAPFVLDEQIVKQDLSAHFFSSHFIVSTFIKPILSADNILFTAGNVFAGGVN